jgi:hypothetical protein
MIASITVNLSTPGVESRLEVDERATFLAEILRSFKRNGNGVDKLSIQYGYIPPSRLPAEGLLQAVADMGIPTVTLFDSWGVNACLSLSYGRRTFFGCTISPGKRHLDHLMAAVHDYVTHLTLIADCPIETDVDGFIDLPVAQAFEPNTVPWTKQQFHRLRKLVLLGSVSRMNNMLDFLCQHRELLTLTIKELDGSETVTFLPSSTPLDEYCPPNLVIDNVWALRFLKAFNFRPDLEKLDLTFSHHASPVTEELDCLHYVGSVEHLTLKPFISVDGLFHPSCHPGARHGQVQKITICSPTRQYSREQQKVSTQALEVCSLCIFDVLISLTDSNVCCIIRITSCPPPVAF